MKGRWMLLKNLKANYTTTVHVRPTLTIIHLGQWNNTRLIRLCTIIFYMYT